MPHLEKPVAYLTIEDFDDQGNLVNPQIPTDRPVVVFIQAGFCGHCTQAKPAYQQFADANVGKVFAATIQADGDQPGEKEVGQILNKIDPGFRGFPSYALFYQGKRVPRDIKGRSVEHLTQFASI
jgi:thiol-disulfide isomerase/thioredoxin